MFEDVIHRRGGECLLMSALLTRLPLRLEFLDPLRVSGRRRLLVLLHQWRQRFFVRVAPGKRYGDRPGVIDTDLSLRNIPGRLGGLDRSSNENRHSYDKTAIEFHSFKKAHSRWWES